MEYLLDMIRDRTNLSIVLEFLRAMLRNYKAIIYDFMQNNLNDIK